MGWTGDFASKKEAIADVRSSITFSGSRKLFAEKSTRLGYYAVVEGGNPGERILWVALFEGKAPRIVHKADDECVGLYGAADCPLAFFDMVPCPNEWAEKWRERCRAHHKQIAMRRGKAKKYLLAVRNAADEIVLCRLATPIKGKSTRFAQSDISPLYAVHGTVVNLGAIYV